MKVVKTWNCSVIAVRAITISQLIYSWQADLDMLFHMQWLPLFIALSLFFFNWFIIQPSKINMWSYICHLCSFAVLFLFLSFFIYKLVNTDGHYFFSFYSAAHCAFYETLASSVERNNCPAVKKRLWIHSHVLDYYHVTSKKAILETDMIISLFLAWPIWALCHMTIGNIRFFSLWDAIQMSSLLTVFFKQLATCYCLQAVIAKIMQGVRRYQYWFPLILIGKL